MYGGTGTVMHTVFASRPLGPRLGALALTAALAASLGCGLRGSGSSASETRKVDEFSRIEIGGAVELVVHVEPGVAQKLELTADDNILPKLTTTVDDGELDVDIDASWVRPKTPIKVEVWVPALLAIEVSGAGDVAVEGLHGESFELAISGAGGSKLRGEVERLSVAISGAGNLDAKQLQAERVDVRLSGAGNAEVWASEQLDVAISGVGNVGYRGNPGTITKAISGVGKLIDRGS
jgi:hypothetical protein